MFVIGRLYAGDTVHTSFGAVRWVVIVSIHVLAAIFCIPWKIEIKIYMAESQPQRTRTSATNLAHRCNWIGNFLVALTTLVLLTKSTYAVDFLFGHCALLTAITCFALMPETKGESLDEIEEAFRRKASVPSSFQSASRKGIGHGPAVFTS